MSHVIEHGDDGFLPCSWHDMAELKFCDKPATGYVMGWRLSCDEHRDAVFQDWASSPEPEPADILRELDEGPA